MSLLRLYDASEGLEEGYPWEWAHETYAEDQSNRHPGDGPAIEPAIKDLIREWANHRCQRCGHPYRKGEHESGEWSPCDEHCAHGGPFRFFGHLTGEMRYVYEPANVRIGHAQSVEAKWRILTVHHLDENKLNCRWWNLVALCQRCHLRMQRAVVMDRPWHYEHTPWFRPYAAGFYAFKYLEEDLSMQETLARQDELLALERRFTREALF